jgi:hypothetical protein
MGVKRVATASGGDPDGELVRKVQDRDRSVFNRLVVKYRNRVMGIAARMKKSDSGGKIVSEARRNLRDRASHPRKKGVGLFPVAV